MLTISDYEPGDGQAKQPVALTTTYLATMHDSDAFGKPARLEAERRGIRQARQAVVLGDGAAWIDTLHQRHFHRHVRIVDWYHAVEHLYEVAKAAHPDDAEQQDQMAERLRQALWDGQVQSIIMALDNSGQRPGPPREHDPPDHPRRVFAQNLGYFQRHGDHMNYPEYRRRHVSPTVYPCSVTSLTAPTLNSLLYLRRTPMRGLLSGPYYGRSAPTKHGEGHNPAAPAVMHPCPPVCGHTP